MADPAGRATVLLQFPCASMAEAQAAVDGWLLNSGVSVNLSYTETAPLGVTDEDGSVQPVQPPPPLAPVEPPPE